MLQERAREILAQAGHDRKPADSLFAFEANRDYLEDVLRREASGAADGTSFGTTPTERDPLLVPPEPGAAGAAERSASIGSWLEDPPNSTPGMARVGLDPDGRLISLLVVPGERTPPGPAAPEPDWEPLLRATGVDATSLVPVPPEWAPPVFADRRAAWTGSWPGKPDVPLRIEAAAAGGKPVSLRIVAPWTRPAEEPAAADEASGIELAGSMRVFASGVVVVAAGFVALRNVRRGRGDRRGALRLALYLGAVRMLWFLGAHHVASTGRVRPVHRRTSPTPCCSVGLAYVFYLAIEPYARRLWPRMLVSWVRILDGRFRDPLVGRDLLVGARGRRAGGAGGPSPVLDSRGARRSRRRCRRSSHWTLESLRGAVPAFVSIVGIHTGRCWRSSSR